MYIERQGKKEREDSRQMMFITARAYLCDFTILRYQNVRDIQLMDPATFGIATHVIDNNKHLQISSLNECIF